MGLPVIRRQVVSIGSRNQWQTHLVGYIDGSIHAKALDLQSIILDLNKEVIPKIFSKPFSQLAGLGMLILKYQLAKFAGGATGQDHKAFLVRQKGLLVDARDIVVALEKSQGRQLDQVFKTLLIFSQNR